MSIDDTDIQVADKDKLFGKWLSRRRCQAGFTLEDVSLKTQITVPRLRSLELATFSRGINMREVNLFSHLYGVPAKDIVVQITYG